MNSNSCLASLSIKDAPKGTIFISDRKGYPILINPKNKSKCRKALKTIKRKAA